MSITFFKLSGLFHKSSVIFAGLLVVGLTFAVAAPASASTTCQFATKGANMKLLANCSTTQTISVPSGMTLNGEGHTITGLDPTGSQFVGPIVGNGGATMNVKNLTVAGQFTNPTCNPHPMPLGFNPDLLRGVAIHDGSGSIKSVTITGINKGPGNTCQEGNGIVVNDETGGPYAVTISNNSVTGFQDFGVYMQGNVVANVKNNTAQGYSASGFQGETAIAAVEVPGGSIKSNTVAVPSSSVGYAGVELLESSNVTVSTNASSGAVVAYAACEINPAASNNVIKNNNVQGASFGIQITSDSNSASTCGSHANNNTVKGNTINDPGGTVGINVFVCSGKTFPCQADSNVLENNTITGYSTPIGNGGTNTVIKNNT
jgi:hypothetical protein